MRNYSLRFNIIPSPDLEQRTAALLDFCSLADIDDVMFFIAPEEINGGHITIEEAKKYTDAIKSVKAELDEMGITVSLNPWCTLSHWDGGRKLREEQHFVTMVGADGTTAERVVCPLCENWRDYYVRLMNFYEETLEPEILWFEDDMRMYNHDPVTLGCFCAGHMARFNAALGTHYDRETFVEKIFTDKRVRKAYLDVSGESIRETLEYIASRIKTPKAFGLMTGGACQAEGRRYKEIFAVLKGGAGHEKPFNRLSLGSYRQLGSQVYAWKFNEGAMLSRFFTGGSANCVSELENFPHTLYTKSVNYARYQLLSTAALGLTGDTFSIFEMSGNGAVNYENTAEMLKSIKPYLSRVTDLGLSPSEMRGVRVLCSEKSSYNIKCKNGDFGELAPFDGWLFAYLTQLGFACAYTDDPDIEGKAVAMSGQTLRNYSPEQIGRIFEKNLVILTADNVEALFDMGLQDLIGAQSYSVLHELDGRQSFEQINSDDEILGIRHMRATAQFFCGSFYAVKYSDESRTVLSKMYDYRENAVADAIVRVKNAVIIPYANTLSDQQLPISLLHPMREYAIGKALGSDVRGAAELYHAEEPNVCMYVFDREGETLMTVMNFSDDDVWLHFTAPCVYENIKFFTPDNAGVRQCSFVFENGRYAVKDVLKAHESFVLIGQKSALKRLTERGKKSRI